MESEEIVGPQFSVHWSTCTPIPVKRFPITNLKIERILTIVECRAKLLGLDAPVRAEIATRN